LHCSITAGSSGCQLFSAENTQCGVFHRQKSAEFSTMPSMVKSFVNAKLMPKLSFTDELEEQCKEVPNCLTKNFYSQVSLKCQI